MGKPKPSVYEQRAIDFADELQTTAHKIAKARRRAKVTGIVAIVLIVSIIPAILFRMPMGIFQFYTWLPAVAIVTHWWFKDDETRAFQYMKGMINAIPYLAGSPLDDNAFKQIMRSQGVVCEYGRIAARK